MYFYGELIYGETNLFEYVKHVSENLDGGRPVDTILLDFSKAFDNVESCLFNMFVNDLDNKLNSKILKFADDKLVNSVSTDEDRIKVRADIDKLIEW